MSGAGPLWRPRPGADPQVLGVGEVSLDLVAVAPRLPGPGGKESARSLARLPGGQVATAMLGCARLGLRAAFVGAVGDDPEGREALAPLRAAGVDVSGVRVRPAVPTRTAQIWVEEASGERAVLGFRDPRLALAPGELPLAAIRAAGVVHLDGGQPEAGLAAARAARAAGVPVVLDADETAPEAAALLHEVDFPVVSRSFAEEVLGTSRLREALARLVEAGARLAVVTLAERGALARLGDREIACPAYRVPARDTTGAGDAFRVGFLWGLLEGLAAEEVLRAAAAAAALNCRELGAQGGLPDRATLQAFLRRERPGAWADPD